MKKILLLVLVALVLVALVACGGETTTASTTTEAPGTTEGTPGGDTPGDENPEDPEEPEDPEYPNLCDEGENIINGDLDYMAIDGFWGDTHAFKFENHHAALNYQWSLVVHFKWSAASVFETLVTTLEEEGKQTIIVNDGFKYELTIDDQVLVIDRSRISVWSAVTEGYIRLGLGENFKFKEGAHDYEISLKIYDEDDKVAYWAWFTQPGMYGKYNFKEPPPIEIGADPSVNTELVERLPQDMVEALSGPAGFNSESYINAFDGNVQTKLCTDDLTIPVVFQVSNDIPAGFVIKSFSVAGANDDNSYPERLPVKFKLYGTDNEGADPDGDYWKLVLTVDKPAETEATQYAERNFPLDVDSTYRYYMLVIEDNAKYQFSEILLYAEKGTLTPS